MWFYTGIMRGTLYGKFVGDFKWEFKTEKNKRGIDLVFEVGNFKWGNLTGYIVWGSWLL